MTRFHFDAVLASEPTDAQVDAAFEAFEGDAPTFAVSAGAAYAMCHVEAAHLEEAMRVAATRLRSTGLTVVRFEVEPETVLA